MCYHYTTSQCRYERNRRPRPPASFPWGGIWGSNPRHPEPQSGALPAELIPPNRPRKKLNTFAPHTVSAREDLFSFSRRLTKSKPSEAGLIWRRKKELTDAEVFAALTQTAETERSLFLLTLARQEGFEPPTYCLEGSCSILLSYWRIYINMLPAHLRVIPNRSPASAGSIWRRRKEIADVQLCVAFAKKRAKRNEASFFRRWSG